MRRQNMPAVRPSFHLTPCSKFRSHLYWLRIHKTIRVTPAMAAGLSATVMDWAQIVEAMDADAPAKKRGPYKKAAAEISN